MHESQVVGLKENQEDSTQRKSYPLLINVWSMYLWSMGIAMGSFVFGYSLVIMSILASTMRHQMGSSYSAEDVRQKFPIFLSICTTALPLGALTGSIIFSRLLATIKSENKLMVISDISLVVLYLLQSLSLNPVSTSLLRFIIGIFVGISGTLVPMYLMSIAPIKISGKIGSFNQIFITIGIATAYGMGLVIDDSDLGNQWRWRICILLPIFACFARMFTCSQYQFDALERHIELKNETKLYEYVTKFYKQGTFSVRELIDSKKVTEHGSQTDTESTQISQQNQAAQRSHRKRVGVAIALTIMTQFSGINAIMFYANQLFSNIGKGDSHYAVLMSFYMGLFQIAVTLVCGSLVDRFGRRSLMILGETIIVLALFSGYYLLEFGAASGWDPKFVTYAIFAHIAGFSLSLGPITIVYLSEILSDISSYMVVLWVETVLVSFTSNILIEKYGIGKVFLGFGLISISCLLYILPTMQETKGKTRKEIYIQYEQEDRMSI